MELEENNMVNLMKSNMAVGCDGKFPKGYVSCYKILQKAIAK